MAEFLDSDIGAALLRDTGPGQRLARQLIGRPVGGDDGMAALRARLSMDDAEAILIRQELEPRLHAMATELRALPNWAALERAEREALQARLAERYLGSIDFAAARSSGYAGYAAERGEFMRGARLPTEADVAERAVYGGNAIPVEAGSIESRLATDAKIDERLVALELKYLREHNLASPNRMAARIREATGHDSVNLREMVEYVFERRVELATELRKLAREYDASEPFLARTIEKAATEIDVSSAARENFEAKARMLGETDFASGAQVGELNGYTAKLRGEMGELRAAVRVSGVVDRGLTVGQLGKFLGKGAVAEEARAELARLLAEGTHKLHKELDLILEGGFTWGEVKTYSERFSRNHSSYTRLMQQAKKTVEIKRALESNPRIAAALAALGKQIELRIYFVGGVTEDAARALEKLGFKVIGVRGKAPGLVQFTIAPATCKVA